MATPDVASSPGLDISSSSPGPGGRRGVGWLSRKRLLVGAAAVAALVGVGGGAAWVAGRQTASSGAAAPVLTRSSQNVKVTTGTMKQSISESGTLQPAEDSDLTFAVSGTVTAVPVIVGAKVTRGQTLAKIDATALADQVAADAATLSSDEDQLTTDEDDSASSSTTDSQKSQVTSAAAQLSSAKGNLSDATLRATFSGTVASVALAVGDTTSGASGSSSSTGGSASSPSTSGGSAGSAASSASASAASASTASGSGAGITVISTHAYTISTSVDDTEVSEVKVGDEATITPSGSSSTLDGTVASVSLIASTGSDSAVASFPVVIDVTGSPTGIYPGASATVSIVVKQLDDVVEVPTAAISYSGGQATVTEVSGASHKTVDVTTGTSLDGQTQITGGLRAGDTVVEQVTEFKTSGGPSRSLFGGSGQTGGRAGGEARPGAGGGAGGFGSGAGGGPPAGGSFGGGGGS